MTTPCSPLPISASQIQSEFGGSNPISLSEYYGVAAGVPASGMISYNDLRCKSNLIYATYYYTTPGTYYRTVPAGVESVGYIVQGPGGAGAAGKWGGFSVPNALDGGGGGASGEMRSGTFPVSTGQTLTIVVGAGGSIYQYGSGSGDDYTGAHQDDDSYPDDIGSYLTGGGYAGSGNGGYSQFTNGVSNVVSYGGLGGVHGGYTTPANGNIGGGGNNTTGSTGAVDMWGGVRASIAYGGLGGSSYFGGSGEWYYRYNRGENVGEYHPASPGAGGCGGVGSNDSWAQFGGHGLVYITWNTSFGYPAFYQARYGQSGGL